MAAVLGVALGGVASAQDKRDVTHEEEVQQQRMEQGKDYDAADHYADKHALPPAQPSAWDEPLQKQERHDAEMNQGRDYSQWDPTPVQGIVNPKPVRPGS